MATDISIHTDPLGPPCPYRASGKTWKAGFLPYSPEGMSIIAQHNGVAIDKLSHGMRYASNPAMLAWMHALGVAQAEGYDVRPNKRWLTMAQLQDLKA